MMDEDEAFEKLNLPQTASEDEIISRFRELSLHHHPDKDGNNDEMAELLMATNIALSSIRNINNKSISVDTGDKSLNIAVGENIKDISIGNISINVPDSESEEELVLYYKDEDFIKLPINLK